MVTGPCLIAFGKKEKRQYEEDSTDWGMVAAGVSVIGVGTLSLLTGITLLIVDAVRFNDLRDQEEARSFYWKPDIFVSPEMAGFGISGRF